MPPTPAQHARARAAQITENLTRAAFILPGTITERMTRCGHPGCRCHADPPRLHGPYHQWTRKVNGKTVTRLPTDGQLAGYQPWFDTQRRLRDLITELETLSQQIADNDPRWNRQPQPAHRKPGPEPPDNAGTARLTCGRHPDHIAFAQLRPKREDLTRRFSHFVSVHVHIWL